MSNHRSMPKSCAALALLLLAFSMQAADGPASSEDFLVQVWDTDSGLPHSTVTSIAQTPDGYLWVGTMHGGLARFDGTRFVVFHPGNTPELRSIEIQKLLVDSQGTLWVGTVEGALISYRDGRFRLERQSPETPQAWLGGGGFFRQQFRGAFLVSRLVVSRDTRERDQPLGDDSAARCKPQVFALCRSTRHNLVSNPGRAARPGP